MTHKQTHLETSKDLGIFTRSIVVTLVSTERKYRLSFQIAHTLTFKTLIPTDLANQTSTSNILDLLPTPYSNPKYPLTLNSACN